MPFTNEFSGILQQMRPDLLVMNDAYPGSELTNYVSVGGSFGGRYSFVPSCRWLPQTKFKSLIISDAGANDAATATPFTTPQLVATNSLYFLPLITNGLMYAPFTGYPSLINTPAMIMSQRSYFTAVINNLPCTDVYDPWSQITMNWLSSVSFTGVHIGGTNTIAGYAGAVSLAQFFSYKTPMQLPYNPAYYQVSSSLLNGTNQMPFNLLEPGFFDTNGDRFLSFDGMNITNIQPFLIQTNFIINQRYTNTYGCAITVSANVVLTTAAVVGESSLALMAVSSPLVGGWTNTIGVQTTGGSLAVSYTNTLSNYIPTNSPYWFTNTSSGPGDTVSVLGGQIKYP